MARVISISEVNKHQDKNSVWMIIHNDVYDVTQFLDEHPGGEEALLDFAGKEATQGFEDVGHSADARELLKKFKIGTLPIDERDKVQPTTTAPTPPPCCPRVNKLMNNVEDSSSQKSWRNFDGPAHRARKGREQKAQIDPGTESPVNVVAVPSSNWKWYILALLGAIAIGVLIKKKMEA